MPRAASVLAGLAIVLSTAQPATAQTLTTFDERGYGVDALRGVLVWARENSETGRFVLMRRVDGRTSRIPGTGRFSGLHQLDLGLDRGGRVVLVYDHCAGAHCDGPFVVNVRRGGPQRLRLPRRRGCELGPGASVWRDEIAFTRRCRGSGSGVYRVRGGGRPRRVEPLREREVRSHRLDLNDRYLLSGGRRIHAGGCSADAATTLARPGWKFGPVDAHRTGLWALREFVGDWGGGETELIRAEVEADCGLRLIGAPRVPDANDSPLFASSLAVEGRALYVSTLEGLVEGSLAPPTRLPGHG